MIIKTLSSKSCLNKNKEKSMLRDHLTNELNSILKPENYKDYCPNGLQVEGKKLSQEFLHVLIFLKKQLK